MNIRIAIVLLGAFGLASCAKYMDNSQPGTADSAAMADSAHRALVQAAAQKLPGVWIRRVETEPGEQGFTLQADGKLTLIGNFTLSGDSWSVAGDTLTLNMRTGGDSGSFPHVFRIAAITDSMLSIVPYGAPQGYNEVYKKRTGGIPKRYTEMFKQHFEGRLSPGQIMKHTFSVPTLFDGGITLTSDSSDVAFYLLKDDVNLTPDPVRTYTGRFVPGDYTLRVMYVYQGRRRGDRSSYEVVVEEK